MIKIITSAAIALMLGSAAFVAPAAAQGVSIQVDRGHHVGRDRHVERRVVERRRVVRRDRCSVKKVVTHRRGERIVRTVRTCR
jgi:hypothetical protein